MLWKLKSKDGSVELTPSMLLDALMSKHLTVTKPEFEVISLEFAKFMQWKEALHEASLHQLILIAFSLGYFFRVFKEKNDVEVIDASTVGTADEAPGSEDSLSTSDNRDS